MRVKEWMTGRGTAFGMPSSMGVEGDVGVASTVSPVGAARIATAGSRRTRPFSPVNSERAGVPRVAVDDAVCRKAW